jgi:hypothetical protein
MWDFQTLDNKEIFSGFDSVEALQNSNPIKPDGFLKVGKSLQKIVQKKTANKAANIIEQKKTLAGAKDLQKAINSPVPTTNESPIPQVANVDKSVLPTTLQDSPNVSGSGMSAPIGGGGGDLSQMDLTDPGSTSGGEQPITDNGSLPPVTITNKPLNPILIAVAVFVLIGIVIFLKRKK